MVSSAIFFLYELGKYLVVFCTIIKYFYAMNQCCPHMLVYNVPLLQVFIWFFFSGKRIERTLDCGPNCKLLKLFFHTAFYLAYRKI